MLAWVFGVKSMFVTYIVTVLFVYFKCITSQDVIGCGGFIKSDVEINYSLVEVKLLSKQGALKYQTDCAPINGYYMIPVYDKGEYSLVVVPPPGWSFEPERIELDIDGTLDACSKGEDINFQFMGFGVTGRVVSLGEKVGPSGVKLDLKSVGGTDILKSTTSSADGSYLFSQVLPGEYTVAASHPKWLLKPATASVTVDKETGHAGSVITVQGYDVTGSVMSEGEPTKGVKFLLYSPGVKSVTSDGCDNSGLSGLPKLGNLKPLCHTLSNAKGEFVYRALPCGEYTVVPVYHGENIKFDLEPSQLTFKVTHNSVKLEQAFQVAGFSVTGKVSVTSKGAGVPGAKVSVGDRQVTTDKDGSFLLETMKAGTYTISVTAESIFFNPVSVKITPNTPQLPEIVADRFSVCGLVKIDKFPERIDTDLTKRKVTVLNKKDRKVTKSINLKADGKFCTDLAPGVYVFKAEVSAREIHAGLMITPMEQDVTVSNKPVTSVTFLQLRVKVKGSIECIEKCKPLQLALSSDDRPDERVLTNAVSTDKKATFEFVNVMPGNYKVSLLNEDWCWEQKAQPITVQDKDLSDVRFTHNGYVLSCSLSHDVTLTFAHDSSKKIAGSFDLNKGSSKFCLEKPGVYNLEPVSCHQFEQQVYKFDTANPILLTFNAVKHLVEGRITTETNEKDIKVQIKSSLLSEENILGPLVSEEDKENAEKKTDKTSEKSKDKNPAKKSSSGPSQYLFSYWARAGEVVEFVPSSAALLFYPESSSVSVSGIGCPGVAAQFEGKKGVFIEGKVTPVIADVDIEISGGEMTPVQVKTDDKGKFRVGPLHPGADYSVSASKEGYVLSPVDGKLGHFSALKLGEMRIEVQDQAGSPLQGVLLSVSGVDYRNNVLTPADGALVLNSLTPGQYFVKPMMKEYVFEPVTKTLSIEQGGYVSLSFKGKRVAYSCHGSVTSLNGEPEQGVVIEALGQGDCVERQEEAKSETDGSFHIRGLQPGCQYDIQLKPDYNTHIERSAPEHITVQVNDKDYSGVHIIAFRRMSGLDMSGIVKCDREHLPLLKVSLFRDSAPDSPIQTVSLGQSPFFHLSSLTIDNQAYFVRLESTLSRSMYDYELPEITFVANKTFQHFTLIFNPVRKSLDQELSQSSFLIVPFTLMLVFLAYNHANILPYLTQTGQSLYQAYQSVPSKTTSASETSTQAQYKDAELIAEFSQTKKRKPKKA